MATPIPQNSIALSAEEVLLATGASVESGTWALGVAGVATDTRVDLKGKLFIALSGDRFDGHQYLEQAASRGAAALMVEQDVAAPSGTPLLRVSSTLTALGDLGRFHRRRWGKTLVAVAGSAGKTTTRSAISTLLEHEFPGRVCSTRGNLNNRIGVPMMSFTLTPEHDFAVFELGTNQRGEVRELSRITEPDIGVLTLIDLEHTEGLGDLDSVAEEEGDLFLAPSLKRLSLVNGDDERAMAQAERGKAPVCRFGVAEGSEYRILSWAPVGLTGTQVRLARRFHGHADELEFETGLFGEPGARAAVAAVALADALSDRPLNGARITAAFSGAAGEPGRLVPLELSDGTVVLDDSYNANPASMRSAITTTQALSQKRSAPFWLVLGEMRELGSHAAREHQRLGQLAAASGAQGVIAVGAEASPLYEAVSRTEVRVQAVTSASAAAQLADAWAKPGDIVLVKGSRGVGLEQVAQHLQTRRGTLS